MGREKIAMPRSKPPHKPRSSVINYKLITANQITLYLRENPGATSADLGRALGGSKSNTCHILNRLAVCQIVTRQRESLRGEWFYTANKIAPVLVNHIDLIRQCLAVSPGITATQIRMLSGVTDIFSRLKHMKNAGELEVEVKMTAGYGRALNHYTLKGAK